MANTYTKIFIHAVFAVKYRQALIHKSFANELYGYMGGIIKGQGQISLGINGMPDHVHLAIVLRPNIAVSDLMRAVKANSSKWINEQGFLNHTFRWQRGFAVFSFGYSQKETIIRYVANQHSHHKQMGFKEELVGLLDSFEVKFKEEYLFDWILEER